MEAFAWKGAPADCVGTLVATSADASAPDSAEVRGVVRAVVGYDRPLWAVAGARVFVLTADASPTGPQAGRTGAEGLDATRVEAVTDASGRFAVTVPPGRHQVGVLFPGTERFTTTEIGLGPGEGVALQIGLRGWDCGGAVHISGALRPVAAS